MIAHPPRFKPSFRVELIDEEGVYLLGEAESHVLRGPAFLALAPLLDGHSTLEDLCVRLAGRVSPAEVIHAITLLRQQGFLADGGVEDPLPEATFWEGLGVQPAHVRRRLREARVTLVSFGDTEAGPLAESLAALGISVAHEGGLPVVLAEDYLHPGLAAFNQERLARGQSWLLVRPTGLRAWLGPLFVPGRTGCWRCLAHRLEGHHRVERYLEYRLGREAIHAPARCALASTRQAVAGMVATAVARWLVEGSLPWA